MNKKRIITIVCIVILFIACFSVINIKYDRLARYPYGTDAQRARIEKELTDKEIEYIVEYCIEPDYFFAYLDCYRFNIYHIDSYNRFRSLFSSFSVNDSVTIVERLILLGKDDEKFYTSLLKSGNEYAVNTLKSYLW